MKPTGLVSGNSLRNKIGSEVCQVGHPRKDWELGTNLSMFDSNPAEGVFDWRYWDAVFDKADAAEIELLCRFTTDTHTHAWKQTVPLWIQADSSLYIQASNNPANDPQHQSRTTRVPRYANPRVRANRKAFLKAFRDRYMLRPSYWKIDASLGGFSGEGHTGSHGYQNSQFDMRGDWRWDYLADYVEVFGAENVFMIANQGSEGIYRAVNRGIIYYRRDGIGAKYQMDELMGWVHNVPTFKEALQLGGFLGEPWDQLKDWPGNGSVQQDFMLTANQLVSLNCLLFFNMDQEIPQQFIDNGFWPKLKAHFATVNDPSQPGDPPPGDGGTPDPTPTPFQFPVTIRGGEIVRAVFGGDIPDIVFDPGTTETVIPIPIVNGVRWNPRVIMRADVDPDRVYLPGAIADPDEWTIEPAEPSGNDEELSFHTRGRDYAVVTFEGYEEPDPTPDPPEYVTMEELEAYKRIVSGYLDVMKGRVARLEAHNGSWNDALEAGT